MDELMWALGYEDDAGDQYRPSASKSFLSDSRYGYDVVVATTQASINATMKQFLARLHQGPRLPCKLPRRLSRA